MKPWPQPIESRPVVVVDVMVAVVAEDAVEEVDLPPAVLPVTTEDVVLNLQDLLDTIRDMGEVMEAEEVEEDEEMVVVGAGTAVAEVDGGSGLSH